MRAWLTVPVLLLLAPRVLSQGLVQLEFGGAVDLTGGAFVEVDVTYANAKEGRAKRVELALHLGAHTGAVDVAALLASRLERAGARVLFTGSNAASKGPANLFVDDVLAVGLRLGQGLSCQVTLCEDRPASLRLSPPVGDRQGANLSLAVSTIQPHTKERKRTTMDLAFDAKATSPDVAAKLSKDALDKGWGSELENHETWRPMNFSDGSVVLGCSIGLASAADWRLDVTLTPRASDR